MVHSEIADLLAHPRLVETRSHMHHSIPKHDHLLRSARFSHRLAPLFGADARVCARAAILHDLDSRKGTLTTHGAIAARLACEEFGEPPAVAQAIVSHMFPFGPRPTTREGWVLVVADKLASLSDFTAFALGLFSGRSIKQRRYLRANDPYFAARQPLRRRLLRRAS